MKVLSFITMLFTMNYVFAQPGGSFTDTHVMGSGSKNASGPGVSRDNNKYKNQNKRKSKGKRSPYTDVIEGKNSKRVKGR